MFNAVSIEHRMAEFFGTPLGDRGEFFDADVFRSGDPKDLAVIVEKTADRLDERIQKIFFGYSHEKPGGAKARLDNAVHSLRSLATQIRSRASHEEEDYHWEVFGSLIAVISALLERLEA